MHSVKSYGAPTLSGAARSRVEQEGMQSFMMNQNTRKCAHIPCLCDVAKGEEYCGESCRYAGREDVEIACQCDHTACPLTFRDSMRDDAADFAN
jgi:hypothetical protein